MLNNQYGYKFEVDNKSYTGWQSPKDNELAIGMEVIVYYDPDNPSKNALTDFHEFSSVSMGQGPVLLFGIVTIAVLIFYQRSSPHSGVYRNR